AAALPLLEKAHRLNPDNMDAALNLSSAYILSKRFKDAVPILEKLSERDPDNAMVWTNLGAAYLGNPVLARDEEQLQAIEAFQQALEVNPVAPHVAYNIGLIYRDRQENKAAVDWFQKALQANPNDQDARSLIARLSRDEEEDEE
ncbi:MAG TPA: tetratricopeptide repeat protein, partial [Chloroflexi bacterium]|nr:tetratricopeptide repeat protein [Chloroflexota bacterium]